MNGGPFYLSSSPGMFICCFYFFIPKLLFHYYYTLSYPFPSTFKSRFQEDGAAKAAPESSSVYRLFSCTLKPFESYMRIKDKQEQKNKTILLLSFPIVSLT
jgi:hypothetical protein